MIYLLWFACGRGPTLSTETPDKGPFDDIGGAENPDWSPDEVAESVATCLESGLPNPREVRDLYATYMGLRDEYCPTFEAQDPAVWAGVWDADCITSEGVGFYGNALYFETVEEGMREIDMMASFELVVSETNWYIGGGEYQSTWTNSEAGNTWDLYLGGTFQSTEGGTWMQQRGESSLFVAASSDAGGVSGRMNGGVGWDNISISFQEMILDTEDCDGMPKGTLYVRDPSTHWFEIVLMDCSGCGDISWREEHQGNICIGADIQDAWNRMWEKKVSWEHER